MVSNNSVRSHIRITLGISLSSHLLNSLDQGEKQVRFVIGINAL